MRWLVLLLSVGALLASQAASAATFSIRPAADVGFPFWCDWGYDWDERCYRDDGQRLPVGGVDDKVWRAAIRFPLGQIPPRATITSARLRLVHDGTCVAPRRLTVRCAGASYYLDVHRILSHNWFSEREPVFDYRVVSSARVADSAAAGAIGFDLTALVRLWHRGQTPNYGLLVKLADWQEDFEVSGPAFPSSAFPDSAQRPQLVVGYTPATG
jgi:TGF-beta propeptide